MLQEILGDDFSRDEATFESNSYPSIYRVGTPAKKYLDPVGLTHKLCPGNEGSRYITKLIEAIKTLTHPT